MTNRALGPRLATRCWSRDWLQLVPWRSAQDADDRAQRALPDVACLPGTGPRIQAPGLVAEGWPPRVEARRPFYRTVTSGMEGNGRRPTTGTTSESTSNRVITGVITNRCTA